MYITNSTHKSAYRNGIGSRSRICPDPTTEAKTKTIRQSQSPKPAAGPSHHFHFAFRFSAPNDLHTCWTPWPVFQDGTGRVPTCSRRESPPPKKKSHLIDRRREASLIKTPRFHPERLDALEKSSGGLPIHWVLRPPQQRVAATYYEAKCARPQHTDGRDAQLVVVLPGSHRDILQRQPTDGLNPLSSTFEPPPVSLLTVSRTLELYLKSTLKLYQTVLVLYR